MQASSSPRPNTKSRGVENETGYELIVFGVCDVQTEDLFIRGDVRRVILLISGFGPRSSQQASPA